MTTVTPPPATVTALAPKQTTRVRRRRRAREAMATIDGSFDGGVVEEQWLARRAPMIDGIVFPCGNTALVDYCVQSDEVEFDFGIRKTQKGHLRDFRESQADEELWTPLLTLGTHPCPGEGIIVEFGEGSFGCYGFVACVDEHSKRLRWLAFFQESNPFVGARCRDGQIEAVTNLGHTWLFPIDEPDGLRVVDLGSQPGRLTSRSGPKCSLILPTEGVPRGLVNAAGRVAWAASFTAVEQVVAEQRDEARARPVESPFRLLGQVYDEESGLSWTRFRCFDAETGRWLSADPLELNAGLDTFGFDGSPVNVIDLLGLTTEAGNPHAADKRAAVDSILTEPESLWGRSADEIATTIKEAGFDAKVRQSTRGSARAQIVEVSRHPEITQIQVHPGGGRHEGAYYKVSTNTKGKIKVVDPDTYKPAPEEKVRIVPFNGGSRR